MANCSRVGNIITRIDSVSLLINIPPFLRIGTILEPIHRQHSLVSSEKLSGRKQKRFIVQGHFSYFCSFRWKPNDPGREGVDSKSIDPLQGGSWRHNVLTPWRIHVSDFESVVNFILCSSLWHASIDIVFSIEFWKMIVKIIQATSSIFQHFSNEDLHFLIL